jgi:nitroimidazol reductase NimA-like FMN-containing flavoprotein (pyridoxamine 5'-phosphate oxidase superfamily)
VEHKAAVRQRKLKRETHNRYGTLSEAEREFLASQRVARIATINADRQPHAVPVCYAFDEKAIFTTLHVKSKRLRNLNRGSKVSVLVDEYEEIKGQWNVLRGLLMYGNAAILTFQENRGEFMHGWKLLLQKYSQYRQWANPDSTPKDVDVRRIIRIEPTRIARWGFR